MSTKVADNLGSLRPGFEEVYCGHCHLATPTWRACIHCFKPSRSRGVMAIDPPIFATRSSDP
jgi:hypothetical protein